MDWINKTWINKTWSDKTCINIKTWSDITRIYDQVTKKKVFFLGFIGSENMTNMT